MSENKQKHIFQCHQLHFPLNGIYYLSYGTEAIITIPLINRASTVCYLYDVNMMSISPFYK